MVEKKVRKLFTILVLVSIGLMIALVLKVKMEQKNSLETARDRYKQMISGEQIVTLTDDILEEDFEAHLKEAQKAKELLHLFLGFFGVFLGLIVIWMLIGAVFNVIDRKGFMNFLGHLVVAAIFAGLLIGGYVLLKDRVLPEIENKDAASEEHYFEELHLVGVQKEAEHIERQWEDESETKIHYYLLTDTGKRILVKEAVYDRYGEPGVYYAGKTEHTIFSLYEGKYFKLLEDR